MVLTRIPTAFDTTLWKTLRWSLMVAAIFWMIVYRLGSETSNLPEFVYVNF